MISVGESLWCKLSYLDFPASQHTAVINLFGTMEVKIAVPCITAAGDDFLILVPPVSSTTDPKVVGTNDWLSGAYSWRLMCTRTADGIATLADEGIVNVLGIDRELIAARAVYDAINAMLAGRASKEQTAMTIGGGGLSLSLLSPTEIMAWKRCYQNEVSRLERRSQTQLGHGQPIRTLSTRFDNASPGTPLFPKVWP